MPGLQARGQRGLWAHTSGTGDSAANHLLWLGRGLLDSSLPQESRVQRTLSLHTREPHLWPGVRSAAPEARGPSRALA